MFILKKRSYFFFKGLKFQKLLLKKGFLAFFDFFFFKSSLFFDFRSFVESLGFFFFFFNTKFLSFFFKHYFFFFFKPGLFIVSGSVVDFTFLDNFYKSNFSSNLFLISFCFNGFFFNNNSLKDCFFFLNGINIMVFLKRVYIFIFNFLSLISFMFYYVLLCFIIFIILQ